MTNMSVNTNEVLTKELKSNSQKIEALELRVKKSHKQKTPDFSVKLGWTTNHKVEKELLSTIKIAYPQFHVMFYFSWALM